MSAPSTDGRNAFIVKGPSGYVAGVGFTKSEAWRSAGFGSLQIDFYKERGYVCVPVTLNEKDNER